MPNTKSAERRVRNSARRQAHNRSIKNRLKTLEKKFLGLAAQGKQPEAATALREVVSAFDKARKIGVMHSNTVSRKKSRLALRLKAVKG